MKSWSRPSEGSECHAMAGDADKLPHPLLRPRATVSGCLRSMAITCPALVAYPGKAVLHNFEMRTYNVSKGVTSGSQFDLQHCPRGMRNAHGADEMRTNTVAILLTWSNDKARSQMVDSCKDSSVDNSDYENLVASPVRELSLRETISTSYLCHMRLEEAGSSQSQGMACVIL